MFIRPENATIYKIKDDFVENGIEHTINYYKFKRTDYNQTIGSKGVIIPKSSLPKAQQINQARQKVVFPNNNFISVSSMSNSKMDSTEEVKKE